MALAWVLEVLALGLLSGYLSGQFGIGGGLLTTPAIRVLLGRPEMVAVATPLLIMIPASLTGGMNFARRGFVRWDLAPGLAGGGLLGSAVGAGATAFVSGRWILLVTGVIMLWVAVGFLRPEGGGKSEVAAVPMTSAPEPSGARPAVWAVGFAVGLYSGFMGLGGGVLMVPALVRIFGTRMKEALGTSLVVIAVYAVAGTLAHAVLGHVEFPLGVVMAAGTVPGAYLGSRVAVQMKEERLRLMFGTLLVVLAVALVYSELAA